MLRVTLCLRKDTNSTIEIRYRLCKRNWTRHLQNYLQYKIGVTLQITLHMFSVMQIKNRTHINQKLYLRQLDSHQ